VKSSVTMLEYAGTEEDILWIARISTGTSNQPHNETQDRALIIRLLTETDAYSSALEFAWISFHLIIPNFVRDQIVRHRVFSYMGKSLRRTGAQEFYEFDSAALQAAQNGVICKAQDYLPILANHPRQQVNRLYPSTVMGDLIMAGNLRMFLNFLAVRLQAETQEETRDVSLMILERLTTLYPRIMDLFLKDFFQRVSQRKERREFLKQS
jgi:thymidylate synthase ThyX